MANAENPAPATEAVNQDDESRMLLSFLQHQRDAVLRIVEGLPEDDWQKPVVPSGWTVAGMLAHIGGAEYHWFQQVTAGRVPEPQPDEEEEEGGYDPNAAFVCDYPSAEIIASYRQVCGMSDEVLAITPLSAAPARPDAHPNPEVFPRSRTCAGSSCTSSRRRPRTPATSRSHANCSTGKPGSADADRRPGIPRATKRLVAGGARCRC